MGLAGGDIARKRAFEPCVIREIRAALPVSVFGSSSFLRPSKSSSPGRVASLASEDKTVSTFLAKDTMTKAWICVHALERWQDEEAIFERVILRYFIERMAHVIAVQCAQVRRLRPLRLHDRLSKDVRQPVLRLVGVVVVAQ